MAGCAGVSFPAFDLAAFSDAHRDARHAMARSLDRICRETGFLVLKGLISKPDIDSMIAAIDKELEAKDSQARPREAPSLRNTKDDTPMSAKNPRIDIGGMLGWAGESGRAFRKLLAHKNLVPYLNALLGPGYRLDH